jgi:hypothetical protein
MAKKPNNPYLPGANYTGPSRSWTEGMGQTVIGVIDERSLAFVGVADPAPSIPSVKAFKGRAEVSNVQVIGSFNWTVGDEAKILIPGEYNSQSHRRLCSMLSPRIASDMER